MQGEYYADALFIPSRFTVDDIGHCFFLRFCYKFKRKMCKVNTVQLHFSPFMFYHGRYCLHFFRFAINLRGKILNPVEFMVRVQPTSFIMDDTIHFFLFKKKYFLFFCFYFLKLILILILFIFISLLSFMLFRKPIRNDNYFLIMHLIFDEVFIFS
jgi:hypothetical protein